MKIKIPAKDVLEKAEKWFVWLDKWAEEEYKRHVEEAMERSWSNLWLGRSERFAKWWLENIHVGTLWYDYKDRLKDRYWRTAYHANVARKMAKVALYSGQEYVWIGEDDLLFMGKEYEL